MCSVMCQVHIANLLHIREYCAMCNEGIMSSHELNLRINDKSHPVCDWN